MISEIRTYFVSKIQAVNPDFTQIDDPIGDDDVSRVDLDNGFKILISTNNPFYTGNSYGEEFSVSIELFKKAGIEVVDSFDSLYETGINVKNEIINPLQVKNQLPFNDALIQSINIESLPTNDKTFKLTLNFNVRVDFTF